MAYTMPNAFYCPDKRLLKLEVGGFTHDNTDNGLLYYRIATSGGNFTIELFKNDRRQAAGLVASGSATLSTSDYLSVSLSGGSGLVFNGMDFDDTDQDRTATEGAILVTLSMDSDLETEQKTIANLAPNDTIEGQGTSGCRFVRFHREATYKVIQDLRRKLEGFVRADGRNMPNILDVINIEDARDAARAWALHKLFRNYANGGDPATDPSMLLSAMYGREYDRSMKGFTFWLDRVGNGVADSVKRARQSQWR